MNCCLGISGKYAPVDMKEAPVSLRTSSPGFPAVTKRAQCNMNVKKYFYSGQTLIQSGGNALVEYNEKAMSNLVRVTVPQGCSYNQIIKVLAPGGKRSACVRIPFGCGPGSTFLVNIPQEPLGDHQDLQLNEENNLLESSEIQPINEGPSLPQQQNIESSTHEKEKSVILVNRPPGISPGTMIHVQVPGQQGKLLQVIVPDGDGSQFYVEYADNIEVAQQSNGRDGITQTMLDGKQAKLLPALI